MIVRRRLLALRARGPAGDANIVNVESTRFRLRLRSIFGQLKLESTRELRKNVVLQGFEASRRGAKELRGLELKVGMSFKTAASRGRSPTDIAGELPYSRSQPTRSPTLLAVTSLRILSRVDAVKMSFVLNHNGVSFVHAPIRSYLFRLLDHRLIMISRTLYVASACAIPSSKPASNT